MDSRRGGEGMTVLGHNHLFFPWASVIAEASIDLHLGEGFKEAVPGPKPAFRDSWKKEWFNLPAHGFALGHTKEVVEIPLDCVGMLMGVSTVARKGLFVHTTAGWVEPGFRGTLTLEFFNASPWTFSLEAGMRIAQLALLKVDGAIPYAGRYQDQFGPTEAR